MQRDLAALEHVRLLRHLERHARVLLDEQDGRSLPVDVADDVEDLPHQQRRKPHRWLVEEEDPRPCQNTAGYGKHLLLASGKRARRSVQSPLQGREPPDLILDGGARLFTAPGPGPRLGADAEVLGDAHPLQDCATLRDQHDAGGDGGVGSDAGELAALEADAPARRTQEAADRIQRAALPGSVRPDQRDDLSRCHRERYPAHRLDVAVSDAQVAHLEQWPVHAPSPR